MLMNNMMLNMMFLNSNKKKNKNFHKKMQKNKELKHLIRKSVLIAINMQFNQKKIKEHKNIFISLLNTTNK